MLSEKIRALRRKSGLSQDELAERLDVSRQAVSKWELGSAVPTADKLVEIADYFGVSLDYLMRGCPENDGNTDRERISAASDMPGKPKHSCRRIAGLFLIVTAIVVFVFITVLYAKQELRHGVSGSFRLELDGVGVIVLFAVLCAAAGAALLISLKK